MSKRWDKRFLNLAKHIAQWSKDPSTKTGAVIVDRNNRIVSIGYNGLPRNIKDSPERLKNHELKYKIIIHCERNALLFARGSVESCRIYIWPFMPCAVCAAMIIQAGITEVIAPVSDNIRWIADFDIAKQLFKEAKVKLRLLDKNI